MFVKTSELQEAFGVKQIAKLKDVLAMNHIPFFVAADGKPVTTQSALDKSLGITDGKKKDDDGVDLSWMDNA